MSERQRTVVSGDMSLSRTVPSRKKVLAVKSVAVDWMEMSPKFRRIRGKSRNPMDKCGWCRHPFADGEMMALALMDGPNKTLCQDCAAGLVQSREKADAEVCTHCGPVAPAAMIL